LIQPAGIGRLCTPQNSYCGSVLAGYLLPYSAGTPRAFIIGMIDEQSSTGCSYGTAAASTHSV
jgi:hypothetical protein